MAITRPTLIGVGTVPFERSSPWSVNNAVALVGSDAHELKAAPGAGYALYITHVTMCTHKSQVSGHTQDVEITLQDEDGIVLYGPMHMQIRGGCILKKDWKNPLKLIDNKALYVKPGYVATASMTVYVEGFTVQATN